MHSNSWDKKLIAASAALAAAGVLVCAAALLDALLPRQSLAGFFTYLALIGLLVTGVAVGYVWVCDKCERRGDGRVDRLLGSRRPNRPVAGGPRAALGPRGPGLQVPDDRRTAPEGPLGPAPRGSYGPTLRGYAPRGEAKPTTADSWHGQ
jgi:hypothetical protein